MLPTSLLCALPLLVQTVAGSVLQVQQSEELGCSSGLDIDDGDDDFQGDNDSHVNVQLSSDSRIPPHTQGNTDEHIHVQFPASNDHAPAQAQPKQHVQGQVPDDGQPKPIVHVHGHVHGLAHDQVHLHPNPHSKNRVNGDEKATYNNYGTGIDSDRTTTGYRSHNTYGSGYVPSTEAAAAGTPSVMARPSPLSRNVAPARSSAAPLDDGVSASSSRYQVPVSPSRSGAPAKPSSAPLRNESHGFMNGLYFTNWNVDEAYFHPSYVEPKGITHAIYAFADIGADGTVKPMNPWFDVQKRWNADAYESGNNAYGCIKRLFIIKKRNRNLKTLLSIGGWTASNQGKFSKAAATEEGRKIFAKSAVTLATDWGMDGLDIDWESPSNPDQARHLVLLLQECREALDAYAAAHGQHYHYLLTAATPAGSQNYGKMDLAGMDRYLDVWNIMSYDFAGTWDQTTGHQASLFTDLDNPLSTKASANQSIRDYIAAGVSPRKINLGVPLYGRSFAETRGLGASYRGTGAPPGHEGTWLYRDLPRPEAKDEYSEKLVASWSYSAENDELVSYDAVRSTEGKARYILDQNLGGAFFWEASGDKSGDNSLVLTMAASLGSLDETENMLKYPDSPYDNIRDGMPEAG